MYSSFTSEIIFVNISNVCCINCFVFFQCNLTLVTYICQNRKSKEWRISNFCEGIYLSNWKGIVSWIWIWGTRELFFESFCWVSVAVKLFFVNFLGVDLILSVDVYGITIGKDLRFFASWTVDKTLRMVAPPSVVCLSTILTPSYTSSSTERLLASTQCYVAWFETSDQTDEWYIWWSRSRPSRCRWRLKNP